MKHHRKPRLRDDHHVERHATWLELFYDLVFAVTVSQLAHRLYPDLTPLAFVQFLGLFVPVWWAWVGQTMFTTRFDSDDPVQRVLTLAQMLFAAVMAVQVSGMSVDDFRGFALAYAALRTCLVLQYLRVWRHDPDSRSVTGFLAAVFAVGVLFAATSAFVGTTLAWVTWLAGLAVDLVGPRLAVRRLQRVPVHGTHLPERFALFTLIFLGESLAAVVRGLAAADLWLPSVVIGVLAFVTAACVWWEYFDHFSRPDVGSLVRSGQSLLFVHLPLMLALAFVVAGVERALQESSDHALSPQTARMLYGGAVLWLASFVTARAVTVPETVRGRRAWPAVTAAALLLALLPLRERLPPIVGVAVVTGVFVTLVLVHERRRAASATSP